LKYLTLEH